MFTEFRKILAESSDLHEKFDKFRADHRGPEAALKSSLAKEFGKKLWHNYCKVVEFVRAFEAGRYKDHYEAPSPDAEKQLQRRVNKETRNQVFITFRRLVGLSCVPDHGPCPLCLQDCNGGNPRASSHVIADAAYRAMIGQFDTCMAKSILCMADGVPMKGFDGPSAIKWKMLCRKCEQFVCDSGEANFTKVLKNILPITNLCHEIPSASWRTTFAATLLWRAMHVAEPFADCTDVAAMFGLYDELYSGMRAARASLDAGKPVAIHYPSMDIHISELSHEKSNAGSELQIFFADPSFGSDCGYVRVQIWTFHFLGVFNHKSREDIYADGDVHLDPAETWTIAEGTRRVTPHIIKCVENSLIARRADMRKRASNAEIQAFLTRCNLIKVAATSMTQFQGQPAIPDSVLEFSGNGPSVVKYCPQRKLVSYVEHFTGEDTFFGNGFQLVFPEADLDMCSNVMVTNFLSFVVDPDGVIKKWLADVNDPQLPMKDISIDA